MNRRGRRAKGTPKLETIEFQVIGELRNNPHRLLLLGNDGACYAYDIVGGGIDPLEPDDSWSVDVIESASAQVETHLAKMAS